MLYFSNTIHIYKADTAGMLVLGLLSRARIAPAPPTSTSASPLAPSAARRHGGSRHRAISRHPPCLASARLDSAPLQPPLPALVSFTRGVSPLSIPLCCFSSRHHAFLKCAGTALRRSSRRQRRPAAVGATLARGALRTHRPHLRSARTLPPWSFSRHRLFSHVPPLGFFSHRRRGSCPRGARGRR
jgi:hypothetical protein